MRSKQQTKGSNDHKTRQQKHKKTKEANKFFKSKIPPKHLDPDNYKRISNLPRPLSNEHQDLQRTPLVTTIQEGHTQMKHRKPNDLLIKEEHYKDNLLLKSKTPPKNQDPDNTNKTPIST